jgi:hypothetical protein
MRGSVLDASGSGYDPGEGFCEHGYKPLVSIKGRAVIAQSL